MTLVHELIRRADVHALLGQLLLPLFLVNLTFQEIILGEIRHDFFTLTDIGQGQIVGVTLGVGPSPIEIGHDLIRFARFRQGQSLGIVLDGQLIVPALFVNRTAVEVQ